MSVDSGVSASRAPAERFRAQHLALRTIWGFLLSGLTLYTAFRGDWTFAGLLMVSLTIALWEFLRLGARAGHPVPVLPALVAGAGLVFLATTVHVVHIGVFLVAVSVWVIGVSLRPPIEGRLLGLALTVFGVSYVVGLGLHLWWIRIRP